MATIRIPVIGVDSIDVKTEDDTDDKEQFEIDPLDNEDNKEIDFDKDIEHRDLNLDDIAGNESGYDSPSEKLEQEIKLAEHDEKENLFQESLKHRIRVIALSRIVYALNHWKIGKYKTDLAHSYIDLFSSRCAIQCEDHASESLKVLLQSEFELFDENEGSEYLKALISTYYALSRAQLILKKSEESEININKALLNLEKLEKVSCITKEDIVALKLKLNIAAGKICLRLQKLPIASNYFHSACSLIEATNGKDSVDLIPVYQFLGKIEQSNGNLSNHSKAIEYYLMAHVLANKQYECHSEQVIQSSRALATAYSIIGTPEAEKSAEAYLNESIRSLVLIHGENHPLVCEINTDLARLLIRCDRTSEALEKLELNLKSISKVFGKYSEQTLVINELIGSLYLSCGNTPEAMKYYKKTLMLEELRSGSNSKAVRNIKQIIDSIKINLPITTDDLKNRPYFNATHRPR